MHGTRAEPGVPAPRRHLGRRGGVRRQPQYVGDLLDRGRPEHDPGPGVLPDGVVQQLQVVELLRHHDRDVRGAPVPQRYLELGEGVGAPVGGREVREHAGPVQQDPQRPPGVLGRGPAGLPGPVRGDQPPLGLARRPLQGGQRPGRTALHGQHARTPRQAGVLPTAAALDDQYLAPVLQGLQRDRAQQGRGAAARLADGQQVRLGGAGAGAPDHRRHVARLVALHDGEGALHTAGVGEAEHGLAGRGDERLGGDARRQRREHRQVELVALLVPVEEVLPAAPGLRVQQGLDPGPRGGLAVGEVGGVADPEPGDAAGVVEGVVAERLVPLPAVGEERARVLGGGEVRHEGLVKGPEPFGLGIAGPGLHGGPVASLPGRRRHQGDQGAEGAVGGERDHEDAGGAQEQRGTTLVLGGLRPLAPPGRGQDAQAAPDDEERMEDVRGAVGGRASKVAAPGRRHGAAAEDAGERAPGHGRLLELSWCGRVRAGGATA